MALRPPGTYTCTRCGTPTTRQVDRTRPVVCIDCSVDRMADVCRQLQQHSGPYFDTWLDNTMRGLKHLRDTAITGPPPDPGATRDSSAGADRPGRGRAR